MNKEIQEQVLKEIFLEGSTKFKPLLIPKQYNEHVDQLKKAISRTIELMEEEKLSALKERYKEPIIAKINNKYSWGSLDLTVPIKEILEEQKAAFRKEIELNWDYYCNESLKEHRKKELLTKFSEDKEVKK